ncbi:MAG: hypothetical protein GX616_27120 [Planctomycetes bacterium]|nr:hypothetical protein [Planctomycetota bacterium]
MVVSWFAILLLVGLIGLVALILGNRNARRVLAGLVIGVVVIFVLALLALVVVRTGVGHRTSSPSLSSRYQYPPEDEATESHAVPGVTVGSNGVVVREVSSSIVVNRNGVSVTDGGQAINVSRNGVVVQQNGADRSLSPSTADRDQAAREVARVAEEVRAVADEVRAMSGRSASQPAQALAGPASPRGYAGASMPPVAPVSPATPPAPVVPVSPAAPGLLEAPDPALAPQPGEAAATGSVTDEWIDAGQVDFEADVYPSERSAAVALARQITKSWDGVLPPDQEPDKVLVDEQSNLEPAIVQAVLQTLQRKLGDGRVEMDYSHRGQQIEVMQEVIRQMHGSDAPATAPAKVEADSAAVRLTISGDFHEDSSRFRPTMSRKMKRGNTVEVTLAGPAGKRTRSVSFVNKPWVEYGIDRASQSPGQERLVARSKRLCPTQSEAEQQAIAEAAKNLVPLVRTALERLESSRVSQSSRGVVSLRQHRPDPELYEKIRAELNRGTGVDDQFTQHIRRPYGDVWQHALLVNASDAQITAHAAAFLPSIVQAQRTQALVRESWLIRAASLILLTVLITVVYGFLNAATRGYYTWMLRGSMVLLVLAGAVVLLLMV